MKLFITGAGGFVGAAVASSAVRAGHEVVAAVRPGGNRDRLRPILSLIDLVEVDLRNDAAVSAAMRRECPQIIIHAAWTGVSNRARHDRLQLTDNVAASCNLLEAGLDVGITKFVGIGSQGEYGPLDGRTSEQCLPQPSSLYGAAKLAVLYLTQQLSAQAGISFAWMRLFSTYGPGDNPDWLIPSLIKEMLDGRRPKTTLGTQLWDYLFIDDVAEGILAAAIGPDATGVLNLGSGQPVAVRSVVEAIRNIAFPGMKLVFGEIPYRHDQVWHMEADIDRLKAATGWAPRVDLQRGLAETVAWHRARRLGGVAGVAHA